MRSVSNHRQKVAGDGFRARNTKLGAAIADKLEAETAPGGRLAPPAKGSEHRK